MLRNVAERLLRVHPLRAADSLQLAAAIIAAEREPSTLDLVCLDERLAEVAVREDSASKPAEGAVAHAARAASDAP